MIYLPSFYKDSLADFELKRREISAVSNATNAEITTTEDHGYTVGTRIRLHISDKYQLKLEQVATILTVPTSTTFTIDVNTTESPTYTTPSFPPAFTQSHVVPITYVGENTA